MTDSANPNVVTNAPVARHEAAIYSKGGKRALDLGLALALLPLIAPVIFILFVIVSCTGNGIFGHKRVGQHGKVFRCWKLRTMVMDSDRKLFEHLRDDPAARAEWARDHKLKDDPRVTRFGRLLRRTSLDELPQIWNVITGDMSFVGPRPVVRSELHRYGKHRRVYLSMKPGITGLWQVSGRNDLSYAERVQLDLRYSTIMSLNTDLRLIASTGVSVLRTTGC